MHICVWCTYLDVQPSGSHIGCDQDPYATCIHIIQCKQIISKSSQCILYSILYMLIIHILYTHDLH